MPQNKIMAKSVICDLILIFKTSVSSVLPENLIRKCMTYNPTNQKLAILGEQYNLLNKNVYIVGAGKAVQNMAREVENILSSKIKQGIISIPMGSLNISTKKNVLYYEGAENNLPDKDAEKTAKIIKNLVSKLGDNDLLIVLISGGGSALLPLPKEPITLEEKIELIKKLANAGADIKNLNTVRKCLSDVKGGQLAIKAQPAEIVSLILSDIVGDPLDLIASGPTTENKDDPSNAINILKMYNLYNTVPDSIKSLLEDMGNIQNFPKEKVRNHIIGSNKIAIEAAFNEAKKINYLPIALSNIVTGNVQVIAKEYVKLVLILCEYLSQKSNLEDLKLQIDSLKIPGIHFNAIQGALSKRKGQDLCLILGGEITVEVSGTGIGGRNQQLALEFSKFINMSKDKLKHFDVYLLSAGTDGIDGPTDAAGAIGYKDLISDSQKENLDVHKYLKNNDTYNFYKNFKDGNLHIIMGHTDTNVMDVHLIIISMKNKH